MRKALRHPAPHTHTPAHHQALCARLNRAHRGTQLYGMHGHCINVHDHSTCRRTSTSLWSRGRASTSSSVPTVRWHTHTPQPATPHTGTGKSSLVCALCIGLAGNPRVRAFACTSVHLQVPRCSVARIRSRISCGEGRPRAGWRLPWPMAWATTGCVPCASSASSSWTTHPSGFSMVPGM